MNQTKQAKCESYPVDRAQWSPEHFWPLLVRRKSNNIPLSFKHQGHIGFLKNFLLLLSLLHESTKRQEIKTQDDKVVRNLINRSQKATFPVLIFGSFSAVGAG